MKAAKDEAAAQGKELDVYAVGVVTCRPTQKEAEEYYHYATIENGDWSAVDGILGKKNISVATVGEEEFQKQRHHYAHGMGGLLMVGDPDRIAQHARRLQPRRRCAASASRSSITSRSCRTSATRCCRGSSAWASARSGRVEQYATDLILRSIAKRRASKDARRAYAGAVALRDRGLRPLPG